MFDEVFVGQRAATLSAPPAFDPISKIIILADSENVYEAGDDTGLTLEVTCPYGTQALADNLLARYKGFTYQPLEAGDALLDPSAELGDGITIAGVYTMLVEQELEFDSHLASKVTAPGNQELESEYPFQTETQQLERKIAQTRSYIKKSNEEIQLLIHDEINDLSSSFTVALDSVKADIIGLQGAFSSLELDLDGLTTRVQDAEGNLAELELTTQGFGISIEGLQDDFTELRLDLDGLTVTDSSGTTRIKGSSVETSSLYVAAANVTGTLSANQIDATNLQVAAANVTGTLSANQIDATNLQVAAANITGTLTANQLNIAGSITWNDLSSGVQSTINGAYASGVTESEVTTLINSTLVSSPTIAGGKFADQSQKNWLKMGENGAGTIGYLQHYASGYSDSNPICVMGYVKGVTTQWVLAPFYNIKLDYVLDNDTVYAIGNWDFSQATVTGLS